MADPNNFVMVRGNVVAEPESRQVGSGTVARLRLAVSKRKKQADGSWSDDPSFFDVTGWDERAAQMVALAKGQKITVIGTLKQRAYTDKAGNKRSSIDIVADAVGTEVRPPSNGQPASEQAVPEETPW